MAENEDKLEEICLGHILNSFDGKDSPSDFKLGDLKLLRQLYGWPGPNCETCNEDQWNKNCPFYKPIKIHRYNVLPAEEPKKD